MKVVGGRLRSGAVEATDGELKPRKQCEEFGFRNEFGRCLI
jgi:hypothetical protein